MIQPLSFNIQNTIERKITLIQHRIDVRVYYTFITRYHTSWEKNSEENLFPSTFDPRKKIIKIS